MPSIKKIVAIGPESTGKSTLSESLARHFGTRWVREYAREYLEKKGMQYGLADLSTIAGGQLALEEKMLATGDLPVAAGKRNPLLFLDTDLQVIKVWSEFVFGQCEEWILRQIAIREYDLYLLCDTDLPWSDDPLREYPDLPTRRRLYHIYRDLLINQGTPWVDISGDYDQRLRKAVDAVEQML